MRWLIDRVTQDLRYARRGLLQARGPTLLAIALLAIGVGMNSSVVMVLDRLLFRTPPGVGDAAAVGRLQQTFTVTLTHEHRVRDAFSYVEMQNVAQSVSPVATVAGYAALRVPRNGTEGPTEVGVTGVVGDYFKVLGLKPWIGRFLIQDEVGPDGPKRVVVLSDRVWTRGFNRDPSVIGRTIALMGSQFVVVGVAPRNFRGVSLEEADYWIPFNAMPGTPGRFTNSFDVWLRVLVRTAPQRRRELVEDALERASSSVNAMMATDAKLGLAPLAVSIDPQNGKSTIGVLTRLIGGGLLVLAIACSNVANLLLIRMSRRRREIATRFALGASRPRLAAQMLTEGLLLALVAGLPAVLAAWWGFSGLTHALMPEVSLDQMAVWLRGIGVVVTLMAIGGAVVSLMPLLYLWDPSLTSALKTGGDSGPYASRFRATLLIVQTTLSVVLLAGAGLFTRSLTAVEKLGFGYHAPNLLLAQTPIGSFTAETGDRVTQVAQHVASLPGVRRVGTASTSPIRATAYSQLSFPDRDSVPKSLTSRNTSVTAISSGYLATVGVPILRGRDVTADDRDGSLPVVLVNASMAAAYWPGENPLGKCFVVGRPDSPCRTVVGVVADVRLFKIFEQPWLGVYLPQAQTQGSFLPPAVIAVDVGSSDLRVTGLRLRQILDGEAGGGFKWQVRSFASLAEPELRPWRLSAILVGVLGIVAAVVTAIGAYGTASYGVSQRIHELSVRRVLGAETADLISLVMWGTLRLVAIGTLAGVTIVVVFGRLAGAILYGVSAHDPLTLSLAIVIELVAAIAACIVPTWYAARVQPTVALASE
ncbi:MAG TPA: ABC transporter permease [Gemmatimonadaceae bacterium]|jgi:predicted permease